GVGAGEAVPSPVTTDVHNLSWSRLLVRVTLNQRVIGSSPIRPTTRNTDRDGAPRGAPLSLWPLRCMSVAVRTGTGLAPRPHRQLPRAREPRPGQRLTCPRPRYLAPSCRRSRFAGPHSL